MAKLSSPKEAPKIVRALTECPKAVIENLTAIMRASTSVQMFIVLAGVLLAAGCADEASEPQQKTAMECFLHDGDVNKLTDTEIHPILLCGIKESARIYDEDPTYSVSGYRYACFPDSVLVASPCMALVEKEQAERLSMLAESVGHPLSEDTIDARHSCTAASHLLGFDFEKLCGRWSEDEDRQTCALDLDVETIKDPANFHPLPPGGLQGAVSLICAEDMEDQ